MPEKPLLILLIGLPGTGKSTLADKIIEQFSSFYSMDKDKYSEILQTTKMPLLFEIFIKIGWLSAPKINQDTIYDLMLHVMPERDVVVQGNFAERITLKKIPFDKLANKYKLCIIHMKCDPNIRRQRIESRDAPRDKAIITSKDKFTQSSEKRIVTENAFIDSIEDFVLDKGSYLEINNNDTSKIEENFTTVTRFISKVINSSEPAPKTPSPTIEPSFPPKMSPFSLDGPEDRRDTSTPESNSIKGKASMTSPLIFSLRDSLGQSSSHPAERSLLQKRTSAPAMNI